MGSINLQTYDLASNVGHEATDHELCIKAALALK